MKYFIKINGKESKPLSKRQLFKMKLKPDTLIWYNMLESWKPLKETILYRDYLNHLIYKKEEKREKLKTIKNIILLFVFTILVLVVIKIYKNTGHSNSNEYSNGLAKFQDKSTKLFGFKNKNNKIIIPAKYKSVEIFEEGYSIVSKNKTGLIDTLGNIAIPFQYSDIQALDCRRGLFKVVNHNKKQGVYDTKNKKQIMSSKYDDIIPYNRKIHNLFIIEENGKYGIYDTSKHKEVIPTVYERIEGIDRECFFAYINKENSSYMECKNFGYLLNFNNKKIIPKKFSDVKKLENNFYIASYFIDNRRYFDKERPCHGLKKFYAFYNIQNNRTYKVNASIRIKDYVKVDDYYFLSKNNYRNGDLFKTNEVISKNRSLITIKCSNDFVTFVDRGVFLKGCIRSYSDGLLKFSPTKHKGYGYINLKGKVVVNPIYDEVGDFVNGIAKVKLSNKIFYINKSGECVKNCPSKEWLEYNLKDRVVNASEYVYYKKGKNYKKGKRSTNTISNITKSVNKNYQTYYNNAITKLISNSLDEGLSDINKAIQLNPNFANSYYIRGNFYQRKRMYSNAINNYKKVLDINPRHIDATLRCAIIYGKQGNKSMSCIYLKKACELGSSTGQNHTLKI